MLVSSVLAAEKERSLKVGLVTDLYYADKLAEAAAQFGKDAPEFIVELGDFIDAADRVKAELGYLKRINRV